MIEACHQSSYYSLDDYCIENRSEKEMMLRLELASNKNNLSFSRLGVSSSCTDCIINGKNIQCKYTSRFENNLYIVSIFKSKHGKNIAYSIDNVEYFIIDTIEHNFYIIPSQVLSLLGFLSNNDYNGKLSLSVASNDYKKFHWSKKFLNRFDLLKENTYQYISNHRIGEYVPINLIKGFLFDEMNIISELINSVNILGYSFFYSTLKHNNKKVKINGKEAKIKISTERKNDEYKFYFKELFSDVNIFIFCIDSPSKYIYIIEKQILINRGITNNGSISLQILNSPNNPYRDYLNNYSIFS